MVIIENKRLEVRKNLYASCKLLLFFFFGIKTLFMLESYSLLFLKIVWNFTSLRCRRKYSVYNGTHVKLTVLLG